VAAGGPSHRSRVAGGAVAAVQASVGDAQRAAPIPGDLSPSIDKVEADYKTLGDCSGYNKTSSNFCQYGDPQSPKLMVVFGDSHSTMWVPSLTVDAMKAHWQLIPVIKEACGFAEYTGPVPSQCGEWYTWAKKTIKTLHPDLIVVSVYVIPGWESGARQVVNDLKGLGTRVLLMSDAPGIKVSSVACLLTKGATQKTCLWPQPVEHLKADTETQSIAQQANIEFVNVSSWFCHQLSCPTIIDSIVAYVDAEHLTDTYARYLAPDLAPRLKLE
jgi:hypothetical protein